MDFGWLAQSREFADFSALLHNLVGLTRSMDHISIVIRFSCWRCAEAQSSGGQTKQTVW
jgi:hypothetical protein